MMFKISLILLLACIFITPVCGAGIQATPPDFQYKLSKGETTTNHITIFNTGNIPLTIEIIPKRLQIQNEHINYNDNSIAKWINIYSPNFILQPHEQHTINFNLTIPPGLDYNDILGAILIHSTISNSNIIMDLIIPIYLHVNGPIYESIHLISHNTDDWILSGTNSKINSEIMNNGTIKTNITYTTTIKGLTGKYTLHNNTLIYPQENITLTTTWHSNPWDFGIFQCNTTIHYNNFGEDKNISFQDQIIIIPSWLLILIGLLFSYLILKKL